MDKVKPNSTQKVGAQFRVDPKLRDRFRQAAKKNGLNASIVVRKLMEAYIAGEVRV